MQTRAKLLGAGMTALATGVGASAWLRARGREIRDQVLADPAGDALGALPEGGRELTVTSEDGTRIHAEVFGPDDAPAVILGHGWMEASRFWIHQVRELSRDHRVVVWDLRGHGQSAEPANRDYSIEALTDDLDAVLEAALQPGEKAIVAGHSLGGMTIVSWAGLNSDRVRERLGAAALVNTGVGGLIAESLVIRTPGVLEKTRDLVGTTLLSAPGRLPSRSSPISFEAVRYITLGRDVSPATVAFCEELLLSCGPDARAGCGATLSKLDLVDSVASLDAPTLVIAGERDRLTPRIHSQRLVDALPDGEYLEVPGIAHMGPVEAPEKVSAALRALAAKHLAPAPAI